MKMNRIEPKEQDPKKRITNFEEVNLGFTEEEAVEEASRCLNCKNPKCVDGCPVSIDIPGFIKKIKEKKFEQAAEVIKKTNNLPAVCGRVCPQEKQCEVECILDKKGAPVNIGKLERFASEYDKESKKESLDKKEKVAIVGAGPAGLTCAADLTALGYKVVIFEALHKPGGVLTYGIPEFRLPKDIVFKEIDNIIKKGVEIKLNHLIGKTVEVQELLKEYKAVFIGCGAGLPRFMDIPGEHLNHVYSANEFLTRVNLMGAHLEHAPTPVKIGKKVIVVGGGNVAMDSARTARRLGADVTVVYRRTEKEMPARVEEVKHAKEEGIHFMMLTNPVEVTGEKEVNGIKCVQMMFTEPDESGRRKPVQIEGSEFDIKCDQLIMAIGQGSNPLIAKSTKLKHDVNGNIIVNEHLITSVEGVFAGGDIIGGNSTVIQAMGDGKRAAKAIDVFIRKGEFI
jgi:glutamate synthase (NADPH/NADH) small chain